MPRPTMVPLSVVVVWLLSIAAATRAGETLPKRFSAEEINHWAFQKVQSPKLPPVTDQDAVRTPIDSFIWRALEARKLRMSPAADKATLLRRATLDLTGVPPTPNELEAFLRDSSSHAFAKVVDRLLASPHYGEHWARHWLDLARYAESEGFKADETRPNAWRYRDYVIRSLNADKPYDRFVQEQIAGDELWPGDLDARVATGFNRHYPDESNARNLMQRRQEILNDITDTVGAVFTGLTYACARCHDHKFDPILQTDYYRLQAFFANSTADDNIPLASAAAVDEFNRKLARWEEATKDVRAAIAALEEPKRKEIIKDFVEKYPEEIQVALAKPETERSPFECLMVAKAKLYLDPTSHQYLGETEAVVAKLRGKEKVRWQELNAELKSFAHLHPGTLPIATGLTDLGDQAPETRVLSRGLFNEPREIVQPGFLAILENTLPVQPELTGRTRTGRRSTLARLLTNRDNPLTARVMVNRVWHYHFGSGLVGTPSDLGLKGERPTHPELLDWLTEEFVRGGWSLKQLHRLIMLSAVYQQSTGFDAVAAQADPENKLLWRYPRHRLPGETIRDSSLSLAGLLNPAMGGPSVFPELPEGMSSRGGWKVNEQASERNRRSVYVFVRRNTRYPMFLAFDMPDTHESCARRNVTTSPIQALTLLNSQTSLDWARHFAGRVLEAGGNSPKNQITAAFRAAYSRDPDAAELAMSTEFLRQHRDIIKSRASDGEPLALPPHLDEKTDAAQAAALVDFCHMLMNSNEFVYLN